MITEQMKKDHADDRIAVNARGVVVYERVLTHKDVAMTVYLVFCDGKFRFKFGFPGKHKVDAIELDMPSEEVAH